MHKFLKALLIVTLALQSFAYAGPVCGNHVSTMESMDCCKKGHDQPQTAVAGDSHSDDCCSACDMGKASSIKAQEQDLSFLDASFTVISFVLPQSGARPAEKWEQEQFHSYSPPEIFLLNETFRI